MIARAVILNNQVILSGIMIVILVPSLVIIAYFREKSNFKRLLNNELKEYYDINESNYTPKTPFCKGEL